MAFEFYPVKIASNRVNQRLDLVDAQALWDDDNLIFVRRVSVDEPKLVLTGKIGMTHCTAVFNMRCGRSRIISVRRVHQEEVDRYRSR